MSFEDYQVSRDLTAQGPPFAALIMAAMRKADTTNAAKLEAAWPTIWDELEARYNAPGGVLAGESAGAE